VKFTARTRAIMSRWFVKPWNISEKAFAKIAKVLNEEKTYEPKYIENSDVYAEKSIKPKIKGGR